jgi:hypothetical protein
MLATADVPKGVAASFVLARNTHDSLRGKLSDLLGEAQFAQ